MTAIEVNNLTKIYRLYKSPRDRVRELISLKGRKYHHEFHALNDISFTIAKGQTVGIIGQNGSGKSTLLKIISGVVRATSGSVTVNGRVASLLELGAGFSPEFTGRENVYMNGALMGFTSKEMAQRLPVIERFAEIGEFIDQPVRTYSSGMYVRLAFAAAINVDPDILIIDEALGVGDVMFRHRCWSKIREFKEKKTILFVSHDMKAVVNLCDQVVWLRGGKIEDSGSPKPISERYFAYMYNSKDNSPKSKNLTQDTPTPASNLRITNAEMDESEDVFDSSNEFGNGAAKIKGMELLDNQGEHVIALWAGAFVQAVISIECIHEVIRPIVGFTVRNQMGNEIFVTNTDYEGLLLPELQPGVRLEVKFGFYWPFVAHGSYSFSPAIADGIQEANIMCDWVYDCLIVEAATAKKIFGLIGIDNMKVDYTIF